MSNFILFLLGISVILLWFLLVFVIPIALVIGAIKMTPVLWGVFMLWLVLMMLFRKKEK